MALYDTIIMQTRRKNYSNTNVNSNININPAITFSIEEVVNPYNTRLATGKCDSLSDPDYVFEDVEENKQVQLRRSPRLKNR